MRPLASVSIKRIRVWNRNGSGPSISSALHHASGVGAAYAFEPMVEQEGFVEQVIIDFSQCLVLL
jgi:hypothetical protein